MISIVLPGTVLCNISYMINYIQNVLFLVIDNYNYIDCNILDSGHKYLGAHVDDMLFRKINVIIMYENA